VIRKKKNNRFWVEKKFLSTWWVVAFLLLTIAVYERAVYKTHEKITQLEEKKAELIARKQEAILEKEDLLIQIDSQSDPKWITLLLMKGLGVAPEGYTKVYFKGENTE
jgi:cell division protein FtsL